MGLRHVLVGGWEVGGLAPWCESSRGWEGVEGEREERIDTATTSPLPPNHL